MIIRSITIGFSPFTIYDKGTLDSRMMLTRKMVAIRYPEMLLNKNKEIRYRRVDTSFTLGSSLCRRLFAG